MPFRKAKPGAVSRTLREILIFLGRKKLGPPDERAAAEIAALNDVDRLHELSARVAEVASWGELLADPWIAPE
jgi:hypothetical protein